MKNFVHSSQPREFFLWIDLKRDMISKNNYKVGSFFSIPQNENQDNLMFLPNDKFNGFVSPFQANLLWNYEAEYNLEIHRRRYYSNYPSRLEAIFLFDNKETAKIYQKRHSNHVLKRELKKVKSCGNYILSNHDCGWIDFLKERGMKDNQTHFNVCKSYWEGINVIDTKLTHYGKPWSVKPIIEMLYLGEINFL